MRPLVRISALSAIVVVVAVLGAACTTNTTIGADTPEATEDQGVAVAPLQTATPTVTPPASDSTDSPAPSKSSDSTEAGAQSGPSDAAILTFDRDINRDGEITDEDLEIVNGEFSLVSERPVTQRSPDLVAVDLAAEPVRQISWFIAGLEQHAIQTTTTTPDGESMWVAVPAGLNEDCPQGPSTQLYVQPITGQAPSTAAEPVSELPLSIVAIHHGPDNNVLLYTGCEGEVRPAALATVEANGNFITTLGGHEVIEFAQVQPPANDERVTAFSTLDSGGLGPIRVESLVSELRADLDMEFEISALDEINIGFCVSVSSPDLPGVWMLAEAVSTTDAVITAVVVQGGPWTTSSGLRVGSTQSEVFAAFPDQIRDEPHKYGPGNYLTFVPADADDTYSIKFETSGHQVTAMHAGRQSWISNVEGCA